MKKLSEVLAPVIRSHAIDMMRARLLANGQDPDERLVVLAADELLAQYERGESSNFARAMQVASEKRRNESTSS
jgi:hypothetical protein